MGLFDQLRLEQKVAEREILYAKHLFTYESKDNDNNDFSHYTEYDYYLSSQKYIILRIKSCVADIHSLSNNSSSTNYYYLPFEYLNSHIRNYNIPEANKYLGISKENCEQYL